jgi:aldose 1-epimerase
MLPPSGTQLEIVSGPYRAVVTAGGAALRALSHDGRPLVDGFGEDELAPTCRGQVLVPWPNRLEDGEYVVDGTTHRLPLTEHERRNATHGLVRWETWQVREHTPDSVVLSYRLAARRGYPWTLDLTWTYALSADGLSVTQAAANRSAARAPFAVGSHPYLTLGTAPVDPWVLHSPAQSHTLTDDRLLPTGSEPVAGTAYDFTSARPIGDTMLDDAFGDLARDADGLARVTVSGDGRTVELWMDEHYRWIQLFTADEVPGAERRSLAVEPMTAQANAFRTGEDLIWLEPDGADGSSWTGSWGIRLQG